LQYNFIEISPPKAGIHLLLLHFIREVSVHRSDTSLHGGGQKNIHLEAIFVYEICPRNYETWIDE